MTNPDLNSSLIIDSIVTKANRTTSLNGQTTIITESLDGTPSMKIVTGENGLTRALGDKCEFDVYGASIIDYDDPANPYFVTPVTGIVTDISGALTISCDAGINGVYNGDLTDPSSSDGTGNATPRTPAINSIEDLIVAFNNITNNPNNSITADNIVSTFVPAVNDSVVIPDHCNIVVTGNTCENSNYSALSTVSIPTLQKAFYPAATLLNVNGSEMDSTDGTSTQGGGSGGSTQSTVSCGTTDPKVDIPFDFTGFSVQSTNGGGCQTNPMFGNCDQQKVRFTALSATVGTTTPLMFGGCLVNDADCCNNPILVDRENSGIFTVTPVCTADAANTGNFCLSWNINNVAPSNGLYFN